MEECGLFLWFPCFSSCLRALPLPLPSHLPPFFFFILLFPDRNGAIVETNKANILKPIHLLEKVSK